MGYRQVAQPDLTGWSQILVEPGEQWRGGSNFFDQASQVAKLFCLYPFPSARRSPETARKVSQYPEKAETHGAFLSRGTLSCRGGTLALELHGSENLRVGAQVPPPLSTFKTSFVDGACLP